MIDDRVLEYLRKMAKTRKSFNGKGLVDRVARDLRCDRTDVRRVFRDLREQGLLQCADWAGAEPISKVTLVVPDDRGPAARLWQEVLDAAWLAPGDVSVLRELGEALEGMEAEEMSRLVQGLVRLRDDLATQSGRPRFEVSARYLLGSSKLLDALPSAPLRRFGIDPSRFPAFPGYVIVAGPPSPAAVILVENPHAFECALAAEGTDEAAWICTFGYGLSLRQNHHGYQLASLMENRIPPRTLTRTGDPPGWDRLLRHPCILFWGDLDLEGLAIFQRLHRRNPKIGLSGIYRPMMDHLRAGGGHPYCELSGKAGQSVPPGGKELARLIEVCQQRALDQEWVTAPIIARWWRERLDV